MQVAHDVSIDGGSVIPGTSLTWAHTCGQGATLLRVGVRSVAVATDIVTGVTYNGIALTKIASRAGDGASLRCLSLWELANPAAGAHNVVVTAPTGGPLQGASSSYFNALVKDAIGSGQTASAQTILAVSATTIAPRSWVQGVFGSTQGASAGVGTVRRTMQAPPAGSLAMCDSDEGVFPAALRNLQVTSPGAAWINGAVATIVPMPSGTPGGSGDLGQDLNTALKVKFAGTSGDVTTKFRAYLDSLSIGPTKDLNTAIWHDLSGE